MITQNYITEKPKKPLTIGQARPRGSSSFPLKKFNKLNVRPFEKVSNDFSSEGLSFKGRSVKVSKKTIEEVYEKCKNEFGETLLKDFHKNLNTAAAEPKSGFKITEDRKVSFAHRSIAEKLIDSMFVYPLVKMPLDVTNSVVNGLKKISFLKKSKVLESISENKTLKSRASYVKSKSHVASIEQMFDFAEAKEGKGESAFKAGHSRLNPNVANYSSPVERTMTRVVTGMGTAFFLANDAYNLSKVLDDDNALAAKEKKRRFKQESIRIAMTAGLTFAALKTFAAQSNKSGKATALIMSGIVVISEIAGRLLSKAPILPIDKKTAHKYALKQGKVKPQQEDIKSSPDKNTSFKALSSKKHFADARATKTFEAFKGKMPDSQAFEGKEPPVNYKAPHEGTLTTKNIMKVLGGFLLLGYAVEKGKGIKQVAKILEGANNTYKKIIEKDFVVSEKELDGIVKRLDENGFKPMAKKYKEMAKKNTKTITNKDGDEEKVINLGKTNHPVFHPLVHKVITFPVRFAFNTIMLPYQKVVAPAARGIGAALKGEPAYVPQKADAIIKEVKAAAKKENKSNQKLLRNSTLFMRKLENKDDKVFKKKVSKSILSSLDNVTKSNYSNAELATVVNVATRATASGFLIADNYNMVMINSNGEDKDLAQQKSKERSVQRASRIVYGAFFISLINGLFSPLYNKSLLGAQAVNIMNTAFVESFTRKSVGVPLKESSRADIINKENENLKSGGFKGSYFRFMANLTGKKPLSQRKSAKKAQASKVA